MVMFFESFFKQERLILDRWATCLRLDLQDGAGESPCKPYDLAQGFPFALLLLCALYCLAVLIFIRRFVAFPLAKLLLTFAERLAPAIARAESAKAKQFRRKKFVGSFVEFVFYTAFFIVGVLVLSRQPWNWPSQEWWREQPATSVDAHLMLFALMYAARYCATFFSLVLLDPRKKDFMEMAIHHVVTIILVCLSLAHGYVRIGTVIMVVFDAADPFLHLAKLFNYIKQAAGNKGPAFTFVWTISQITDLFLGAFAIVFTITRIFVYSYIVYSVSYESYIYTHCPSGECTLAENFKKISLGHHACVVLVWIINVLQWYWFKLLVKVIYRTLVEGVSDDARSDVSEQEGDDKPKEAINASGKFVPVGVNDDSDNDGPDAKKNK